MLEVCITMPADAQAVSHIMVEAYKKYILIWLIFNGGDKTEPDLIMPKYTSSVVSKYIKPLCTAYTDLTKAFYSVTEKDNSKMEKIIEKHGINPFGDDGNMGLVSQVLVARQKAKIKRYLKQPSFSRIFNQLVSRLGNVHR